MGDRIRKIAKGAPSEYLRATSIIDFGEASVQVLAASLRAPDQITTARRCFEWVRDEIRHSLDYGDDQVTLSASDVVREHTGLCYSKSHLLAALLRANGIPCGFVYQRLTLDEAGSTDTSGSTFCLHGLNAIWLPDHGWYRVDARGNRPGVTTFFDPPHESLAFDTRRSGETTSQEIYAEPLPVVVNALQRHISLTDLSRQLPDANLQQ